MTNKAFIFLIVFIFIFSACSSATPQVDSSITATVSPTVTKTQTPTPNITPLPTIPTFTPTFDVSTIVTVTLALTETCPQNNPNLILDRTPFYEHTEKYFDDQIFRFILEYLNEGGSWEILTSEFSDKNKYGRALGTISEFDLTNDGIKDVIVEMWAGFGIYSCKNGVYELSLNLNGVVGEPASIVEIKDMNLNGVPEIVIGITFCSGLCSDISIFEWNGQEFQNLLGEWQSITSFEEKVMDINNDGIFELVIEGPFPSMGGYIDYIPLRGQTDLYVWNGKLFTPSRIKFSAPEYRFHAIQDADIKALDGQFDDALAFYRNAIISQELKWWSGKHREYEIQRYLDIWKPEKPTPPPSLPEDSSEYPSLASYAYYRIMLLQFVQGQESEANQTYQTLLDTFGNDVYAKPYIEMATEFLQAYQINQSMYAGCAAAIQYAVEHPEILIPLGSDYHGWQAKIYEPEDVFVRLDNKRDLTCLNRSLANQNL